MKKKIIHLTVEEVTLKIAESVLQVMNEKDTKIYARVCNATNKAQEDNQKVNAERTIGNKNINNDGNITKASQMQYDVEKHWLKDFIGKTFKFFAEDRLGLVVHLLFTFDNVFKLDWSKTVLTGDVVFNNKLIKDDSITIDFVKHRIQYHERGSRQAYNLEIDNRFKELWLNLTNRLQEAELKKEQESHIHEGEIKLSPKIDIEEKLRNGYITADDYEKSHPTNFSL